MLRSPQARELARWEEVILASAFFLLRFFDDIIFYRVVHSKGYRLDVYSLNTNCIGVYTTVTL